MFTGHHNSHDKLADNILVILKLIAKFALIPVGCVFHSVALGTTTLWKPVPTSNGSSANPDPTAMLASCGPGLSSEPSRAWQGLCCCRGWKTNVSHTAPLWFYWSGKMGANAREQPVTRSVKGKRRPLANSVNGEGERKGLCCYLSLIA